MNDETGLVKDLVGQSKGVLEKVYDDIAHPTARSLGNTISLVPRTVGVWLGKWEKWVINGEESIRLTAEAVREKAAQIPEDKLTEPEPYVAVPAIQQLSCCFDSEALREMYANLLISSMNIDTKNAVHPSFVEIIKQLSPDEAKLLQVLPTSTMVYSPLVDVRFNLSPPKGHVTLIRNFTNIAEGVCEAPNNICAYMDNLARLGIISILEDIHLMEAEKYLPIEKNANIQAYLNIVVENNESVKLHKKSFIVTPFGLNFMSVCLEKQIDSLPLF